MSTTDLGDYFASLYREDDPFGYRDRWYEARKRALLLAMLPHARYRRAWEIGCSNGELTAALAGRCRSLLANDLDPRAVELARARVTDAPHVQVVVARQPDWFPSGVFDLVVASEVGYYLPRDVLPTFASGIAERLTDDGTLVACHWRHAFAEAPSSADEVHAALAAAAGAAPALHYLDEDVRIDIWTRGPGIARRERLR